MNEKRTHSARKKKIMCVSLVAVFILLFSTTVSAKKVYLDEIEDSIEPVYVKRDDQIVKGGVDLGDYGMKVRYEVSESSEDTIPGSRPFYLGNSHTVHEYEYNGMMYTVWRVKYASTIAGDINVRLIPSNGTQNYVGYFQNWTYESEEPCVITIKNTQEPEFCYANFENGKQRVVIDEGTDRSQKLKIEEVFEAYPGSTIIEIEPKIIHGLRQGNHTITVYFADGRCTVNFVKGVDEAHAAGSQPMNAVAQTSQQSVAQNGKKLAPKTGEV